MAKQAYVASDGKVFDTEEAANEHEEYLSQLDRVDRYVSACLDANIKPAIATSRAREVKSFLLYELTGKIVIPATRKRKDA